MASMTKQNHAAHDNEAEPIPTSLDISQLLLEHSIEIKKLQTLCPPPTIPDPYCLHDDLFFLRYILSFTTAEKAQEAVEYTYKFRMEPKFLKLAQILAEDKFLQMPVVLEAKKWQVGAPLENVFTKETGGGVAVLIRAGMCNMSMMHDRITKADMWEMNLAHREGSYQKCDQFTRETGMLCKQTMFMDMTGSALSSMMDRRQNDTHAEISKIGSLVYPQLMDKFCIVNAPTWMGWLMSIFKKIASKRSMEKVELFTSTEQLWNSEFAKKRLIRANFPHFVGGNIPEEELNDDMTGKNLSKIEPPKITISARSKEIIEINIPNSGKTITIDYCVSVLARGVEFSATFVPLNGSDSIVLRKGGKIKAEDGPMRGVWNIEGMEGKVGDGTGNTVGTLKIEFDNSYSMLRSKTVIYSFDIDVVMDEKTETDEVKEEEKADK